jgi:hypothetical protein
MLDVLQMVQGMEGDPRCEIRMFLLSGHIQQPALYSELVPGECDLQRRTAIEQDVNAGTIDDKLGEVSLGA